jgi:1-acyl-sn-glycerol-3-phosphate acyltransferase
MFEKIKNIAKSIIKNTRATWRAASALLAVPALLGLAGVQLAVAGPVFRNYTFIPKLFNRVACHILGYKVIFNKASAPIVKEKGTQTLFAANHLAMGDPLVLGSVLDTSFVGKAELENVPGFNLLLRLCKFIAVRRKSEFSPQARGKIVQNLNDGINVAAFLEGTTDSSKYVRRFHAALPRFMFRGEEGKAVDEEGHDVKLKKKVVLQPVAIVVKEVNGHAIDPAQGDAENDRIRERYCHPGGRGMLGAIWKRLQMKTVLEVTVLPPLDPRAYPTAEGLVNQAASAVAGIVNPGQSENDFVKAKIPVTGP